MRLCSIGQRLVPGHVIPAQGARRSAKQSKGWLSNVRWDTSTSDEGTVRQSRLKGHRKAQRTRYSNSIAYLVVPYFDTFYVSVPRRRTLPERKRRPEGSLGRLYLIIYAYLVAARKNVRVGT